MKRIIISTLVLCGLCIAAAAQGNATLEQLRANMSNKSAAISYSYTLTSSGLKTLGEGTLTTQDKSYVMKGNGLRIYCNGTNLWVVDDSSKEILIDSVSQGADAYLSNPVLLLADLNSIFTISQPVKTGNSIVYKLSPKQSCGISSGTVTISVAGSNPVFTSGSFKMSDGGQLDIKIKSMTYSEKKPLTFYVLDLSGFDSSWMITDLR